MQEQPSEILILCGLQETPSNKVRSWWTAHTSHPPTQLKMSNLLRPKHDQNSVTSLTMYGACNLQDVPAVQRLPSGLLLKGLLGKKWKEPWHGGSSHQYQGILVWNKWINYYRWLLLSRASLMLRQLLHWRGRILGNKAPNPPPPVQSLGQLQQAWKTNSSAIEIPGLDTATSPSTSVHALKKSRLQIKPGSGGYGISFSLINLKTYWENKWLNSYLSDMSLYHAKTPEFRYRSYIHQISPFNP